MFRILVFDDNTIYLKSVEKVINNILTSNHINGQVHATDDLSQAIDFINRNKPDKGFTNVFFLDIEIRGQNSTGFDLAKQIRKNDILSYIVFLTGYDEYMPLSFEVQPFRFLKKPASKEKIEKCIIDLNEHNLARLKTLNQQENSILDLNNYKIICDEIIFIERTESVSIIHLENRQIPVRLSLDQLMEKLPGNFNKCYKSHIINTNHLFAVEKQKSGQLDPNLITNKYAILRYNRNEYLCPVRRDFEV